MSKRYQFGREACTLGENADGQDFKVYGDTSGKYLFWDASANTLYVDTISSLAASHLALNTQAAGKNVRINSKTFTGSDTESIIGMQCKPRAGDLRKAGIYGAEFEPGINEGFAGTSLVGVAARPVIKASASAKTGNLSGDVRAFEASVGTYDTSTRTIAGTMSCLWCDNNAYGTITGGVFPIHVKGAGGGTVAWSGFAYLPNDSAMAKKQTGSVALPNDVGWIRVKVDDTFYRIPLYNNS